MKGCVSESVCPEQCECRDDAKKPLKLDLNTAMIWKSADWLSSFLCLFNRRASNKSIYLNAAIVARKFDTIGAVISMHGDKYLRDTELIDYTHQIIAYIRQYFTHGNASEKPYMWDIITERYKELMEV
jgi:hypothetical protein